MDFFNQVAANLYNIFFPADDGGEEGDGGSGSGSGGSRSSSGTGTTNDDGSAAPVGQISVGDITQAGADSVTVTVVYTDDEAVSRSSVGGSDLTVAPASGGTQLHLQNGLRLARGQHRAGHRHLRVLRAPGGSWDASDDGPYTVTMEQDRVFDQGGHAVPVTQATFQVNIPGPTRRRPQDTTPPVASIGGIPPVTDPGQTSVSIPVTYTDDDRRRRDDDRRGRPHHHRPGRQGAEGHRRLGAGERAVDHRDVHRALARRSSGGRRTTGSTSST